MGLHYSERKYYSDEEENEEFIRIYGPGLYCRHGQTCHVVCYKCKEEYSFIRMQKYWKHMNIKYKNFNWNAFFGMESPTPDNVTDEGDDFKIMGLKKSSSKEDLKKAYHKLCKETHPDKVGGDGSAFKRMKQAYDHIKRVYFD
jgi:DnaJ-class molecular chaperone